MKELIAGILHKAIPKSVSLKKEQIISMIEISPSSDLGDYSFPCFSFAKTLKMSPNEIALDIRQNIKSAPEDFDSIETKGPYINFFVNKKALIEGTIKNILLKKENYGKVEIGKGKTFLVEFSSPNIAKPFGIGHLRSTIIGNSIANLSDSQGFKTIRMNYPGDWGTQFGKIIFGFKKFGNKAKLKKDPIKHLLEIYVKANKETYEEKAREEFRKLEQGDKENLKLWEEFRDLSLKRFNEVYKILGIKFDFISGESFYNKKMDFVLEELRKKKLLEESQGALIVNLEKYGLGVCLIQKSDGATIYATRDLAAAIDRQNNYKFDIMVYEVGQEQKLHFKQFFKVLELMGYEWAKNCIHVDHGLYLDKDGKKFATRKGKTVFLEDIINETKKLAEKELLKRDKKISKKKLEEKAMKIAIAAIFYGDLKNTRTNNMIFDLKRFISFEGNTGPYLQYSYARANSILKKSKKKKSTKYYELENVEFELVKQLSKFEETLTKSFEDLNPSIIANYAYTLSQTFNEFYQSCPVVGNAKEEFRISLVESFKIVLKNSLSILGIEVMEEM